MDKMKLMALALGIFALAVACNNKVAHEEELQQIDSLQVVLEDYQLQMDSLDSEKLKKLGTHVDTQYEYILEHYPDSADRDFWVKDIAYFGQIRKSLNRFGENEKSLREDIGYNSKQLRTLAHSIRDEKLTDEEVEKYFEQEVRALQSLDMKMRKTVPGAQRAVVLWDTLGTAYDSITDHVRSLQ